MHRRNMASIADRRMIQNTTSAGSSKQPDPGPKCEALNPKTYNPQPDTLKPKTLPYNSSLFLGITIRRLIVITYTILGGSLLYLSLFY